MSFKSERVSRWASSLLSRGYSLDSIMWLIESHGGEAKVERNLEVGDSIASCVLASTLHTQRRNSNAPHDSQPATKIELLDTKRSLKSLRRIVQKLMRRALSARTR